MPRFPERKRAQRVTALHVCHQLHAASLAPAGLAEDSNVLLVAQCAANARISLFLLGNPEAPQILARVGIPVRG